MHFKRTMSNYWSAAFCFCWRMCSTHKPSKSLRSTLGGFLQYDNEGNSIGLNSRLRWTFMPLGDPFVVYNHNLAKSITDRWIRDSKQLLMKLQYNVRI